MPLKCIAMVSVLANFTHGKFTLFTLSHTYIHIHRIIRPSTTTDGIQMVMMVAIVLKK